MTTSSSIRTPAKEVDKLKGLLLYQDTADQDAVQAQVTLKLCTEKHQADGRKWLEEKTVLIRLAQGGRGQEPGDEEVRTGEALVAQLTEKEPDLLKWRKGRDTLVAALEVQLTKLLSSIADKDEQIASLRCNATSQPAERKSAEIDKDDVHSETRRNPRTGPTPKLAVQQDEPSPAGGSKDQGSMRPQDSQSSLQSRKEGTMRKIGRLPPELPNILR
ncbi:hypothetical protein J4Q44_G00014860 [Coregonus suidteri]|uniref:Uncharacterized protein n=1 Tax=Coregonus suidteri TaxID=861788 RepID=A0AAN8R9U6_9TELE